MDQGLFPTLSMSANANPLVGKAKAARCISKIQELIDLKLKYYKQAAEVE